MNVAINAIGQFQSFRSHRGTETQRENQSSPLMVRVMPFFISASPKFSRSFGFDLSDLFETLFLLL